MSMSLNNIQTHSFAERTPGCNTQCYLRQNSLRLQYNVERKANCDMAGSPAACIVERRQYSGDAISSRET